MAVGDKKGGLGFTVIPSQQMGVGVLSLEIINAAVLIKRRKVGNVCLRSSR